MPRPTGSLLWECGQIGAIGQKQKRLYNITRLSESLMKTVTSSRRSTQTFYLSKSTNSKSSVEILVHVHSIFLLEKNYKQFCIDS